jgi:hypothetical protein
MPRNARLSRLEHLAAKTIPEPVDTSWTKHPDVVPILDELRTIPLALPPCSNPQRASTEAIAAAMGNPQVRKLMCDLAGVMCAPGADTSWIPKFARRSR